MADFSLGIEKINELLREVRVDYSQTRAVDAAVAALREVLLSLPERKVSASLASKFVEDLGVPESKAVLNFVRPESVDVVGSYVAKTVTKPDLAVDLAVRMPKSCFWYKDFLNHRYHAKRALYLAVIEQTLASSDFVQKIEWSSLYHDARKPVLVVHTVLKKGKHVNNVTLRILPTISSDVFEISKLASGRNNVRDFISDEGSAQSTPFYSASIVEDMFVEHYSRQLAEIFSHTSALQDVVCLLKVWLRQRNFQNNQDSLNGYLIAVIVGHLTTSAGGKRLRLQMTVLQLFRAVMEFLASNDFLGKGVFLQLGEGLPSPPERKQSLETAFQVCICDTSIPFNLAYRMTRTATSEVKKAATDTLASMSSSMDIGFDAVFMTPVDFASIYDYHVRVDMLDDPVSKPSTSYCLDEEYWRLFESKTEALLLQALQERCRLVRILRRSLPKGWDLGQGLKFMWRGPVFAGIVLNEMSSALRMATVGPSADKRDESKVFQAFWGSKAELRRWADGTITETAAWECEPWQRHLIIKQIVEHVLRLHLGSSITDVHVVAGQLDFSLLEDGKDGISALPKLLDALNILSDRLRSLQKIPLKVVGVHPLSSAFRQSAVFPPLPHLLAEETKSVRSWNKNLSACLEPLEVLIQLEGSGSWPDGKVAVQKTKMAFCLQIAETLQNQWDVSYVSSENAVDLFIHGFAFRLSILYEKDPTMLSKDLLSSSLFSGSSMKELISLDSVSNGSVKEITSIYEDGLLRSMHTKMLDSLQGLHPAYGPTVRLAKRWIAVHFFGAVVCQEAVELLVAYLFVRPYPYSAPSSRITGFLRFLKLIAKHDWNLVPVIVDVNGDLTVKAYDEIMAHFDTLRSESSVRGPAMYISTPYDLMSRTWTLSSPSAKDLKKIVAYAQAAVALLTRLILKEDEKWLSLFRTPLNYFDIVVNLHENGLAYPGRILFRNDILGKAAAHGTPQEQAISRLSQSAFQVGAESLRKQLLVGFDPISYFVQDLKLEFGSRITLWYDPLGGSDFLGLTLDKSVEFEYQNGNQNRQVQISSRHKRKRARESTFPPNSHKLSRKICEIGQGLVRSVHLIEARKKLI